MVWGKKATVVHTAAIPESWLTGSERNVYTQAARDSGLTLATMFVGFDGQSYADRDSIARTVGLAIPHLREHRLKVARRYLDLAVLLDVPSLKAIVSR